jgi:beta-lactamase class A
MTTEAMTTAEITTTPETTTVETTTAEAATVIITPPTEATAEDIPENPGRFDEIGEIISRYGGGVSVFYKDLTNGETYFYNPEQRYFIASLIKAPYAVYVYKCAMAGLCNLSDRYMYKKSYYMEGTGKIKEMEHGAVLTLEELIYYAIRWSDNIAMRMMTDIFPRAGFKDFAAEIGLPHLDDVLSITTGLICAECAAVYIEAVYNFIEENNPHSQTLKEYMLGTNERNRMIIASYPVVRKYGWAGKSFHDMGIVYNENRPYLIAILSDRDKGDFAMFKEISLATERYNDSK